MAFSFFDIYFRNLTAFDKQCFCKPAYNGCCFPRICLCCRRTAKKIIEDRKICIPAEIGISAVALLIVDASPRTQPSHNQEEIMFDKHSDYALNKLDPEAIVCPSATGIHIRLTREDFASEEDFLYWKKLSDGDYKDIESAGRGYYDYCISLTEARKSTSTSAEDAFLAPLIAAEQREQRIALLKKIKDALTETQYRRLWMYCVEEMNEAEIAQAEHVGQPRVCRSLCRAKIILKKIFSEGSKTGDKNG